MIEGTRSSLSDPLMFELDQEPEVPLDDVVEVSNCVAARNCLSEHVQRPKTASLAGLFLFLY